MAEDVLPEAGNGDYFVFLHYMDVHYPYYKHHSFKGRFREFRGEPFYVNGPAPELPAEDLEYSMACYDEGIIHLDSVLEGLFGVLERSGRLDDTLVIIVSDHGDEFLEHGGLGHGTTCYNELLDSFILFVHPRLAGRDIKQPVSLTDVFPTLLEWAGVPAPAGRLDGVSLAGILHGGNPGRTEQGRLFFSELGDRKALIDWPMKFIYDFNTKTAELFDLAADPPERNNLALQRLEETACYEKRLKNIFDRMVVSYSETRLDETEKHNLRSLGYIR
jgi:arylsulfatase A-like enzyme